MKEVQGFRSTRAAKATACWLWEKRLIGYDFYRLGTAKHLAVPALETAILEHFPSAMRGSELIDAFINDPCRADEARAIFYRRRRQARDERRATNGEFFSSHGWQKLRYKILVTRGGRCEACGRTAADGIRLHVDHIKPRSKYPNLAMTESNLQVLCADCNLAKSNKDMTDWRQDERGSIATATATK